MKKTGFVKYVRKLLVTVDLSSSRGSCSEKCFRFWVKTVLAPGRQYLLQICPTQISGFQVVKTWLAYKKKCDAPECCKNFHSRHQPCMANFSFRKFLSGLSSFPFLTPGHHFSLSPLHICRKMMATVRPSCSLQAHFLPPPPPHFDLPHFSLPLLPKCMVVSPMHFLRELGSCSEAFV